MASDDRYRAWVNDLAGILRGVCHQAEMPLLVVEGSLTADLGVFDDVGAAKSAASGYRAGLLHLDDGTRVACLEMPHDARDARLAALPARIAAASGASALIAVLRAHATQAPNCVLGVVKDHINLSGDNPLVGPNPDDWGVRFPDMSDPYPEGLRRAVDDVDEMVFAEIPRDGAPDLVHLAARVGADAYGSGVAPLAIASAHAGVPFSAVLVLGEEARSALGRAVGAISRSAGATRS